MDAASPLRILVAEDEPHIGRIIATKLEQGPFAVTLVADGAEALAALDRDPGFRLLVLDLMMPRVDGMEVLRRLRAGVQHAALPCIVLTAAGRDASQAEALALGATDFLTKPFSPKRLYRRVAELTGVPLPPE